MVGEVDWYQASIEGAEEYAKMLAETGRKDLCYIVAENLEAVVAVTALLCLRIAAMAVYSQSQSFQRQRLDCLLN